MHRLRQRARFTGEYPAAHVYVIAVAAPYDPLTGKADASFIEATVENVPGCCPEDAIIVVESAAPPRHRESLHPPEALQHSRKARIAHAPERIIPGNRIYELIHSARTIGADATQTAETPRSMYQGFCQRRSY